MCNCLVYAVWMRIRWGGRLHFMRSRTWRGFHVSWIRPDGREFEYTLKRPKKQPWWYIPICYQGVVKELL